MKSRELAEARYANVSAAELLSGSETMARLMDRIEILAASDAPVLITGESGTGKELVARLLHARSPRRAGSFVAVSCASLPETLLEAELFGHTRGAFTGAVRRRDGRFVAAQHGTLLLDEIGEVPLPAQAKLLRVLQEGTIEPLGADASIRVDARVVSATHQDLKRLVRRGSFRGDLYYRLNVLDIHIPALRERRHEVRPLVRDFLARFAGPGAPEPTPAAWAVLESHDYPGNVRELAHAIEHAVVLARGGPIDVNHLPADLTASSGAGGAASLALALTAHTPLARALREFELRYLLETLRQTDGNRSRAARLLGISRKALWQKLRRLGAAAEPEPGREQSVPGR